jgi:hypothetical protein
MTSEASKELLRWGVIRWILTPALSHRTQASQTGLILLAFILFQREPPWSQLQKHPIDLGGCFGYQTPKFSKLEHRMPDIIYTKVDEAPELASASLLPIIRKFAAAAGVSVGTKDISLSGRILAAFPDHLSADQFQSDDLEELGRLVKTPEANV